MTRRTTSLVTAGVVLACLLAVAFFRPMPYVVMSPGLTENTLGTYDGTKVITVQGHKVFPTSGHLNLTTVSVTSPEYSPRLSEVLNAWWSKDDIVMPRDVIYPPRQSVQDVVKQNQRDMTNSQNSAIAAGLAEAGIWSITPRINGVEKGAPAEGVLQKGDLVLTVDGTPVHSLDATVAAISDVKPGGETTLTIRRGTETKTVTLTTEASKDDPSKSRIGVILGEKFHPPFKVSINLGQDIGGPSAGTMFALAIYDLITPGKLTGGRFVAGTGTITSGGAVGPIGGVQQKIAGAYRDGATVFLVPSGDCSEAAQSPLADKIKLIQVSTLDDAVQALKGLDSGNTSQITLCTK